MRGQKTVQNGKKIVALLISGPIYHIIVIYGAHVLSDNISIFFFFNFSKFDFPGRQGGERIKNDPE